MGQRFHWFDCDINDKFTTHFDAIEQSLKSDTVGLVTLDQMKAKQETFVKEREKQISHAKLDAELKQKEEREREKLKKKEEQQKKRVLSFNFDDEEDEEDEQEGSENKDESNSETPSGSGGFSKIGFANTNDDNGGPKRKKLGKDPTVDTSFLPDKHREEQENLLREKLSHEWKENQEKMKAEPINIAFSYWDGSGHRKDLKMKKGHTIGQFLAEAINLLRPDFTELKAVSGDSLMFIKEDLIIPHFYSFSDFIVTRAMGKTGPLFEFDAAAELRVRADAAVDTAESHPAKICLRTWYERNKHIYPSSQWEPFDAMKKYGRNIIDLKTL